MATSGADGDRHYSTGEALRDEFRFLHGEDRWNPHPADADAAAIREAMIQQAVGGSHIDPAEAELLALHAWSTASLPAPGPTALCLSGGGIRSAAFALGILQGLARRDLLRQFHYLSTVSGGGYIGSWFTAWRYRVGLDRVLSHLRCRNFGEFSEPEEMQRLRFNQNFLTPKVGLGSADTWAAIATVIRNLILNWLVFLPLFLGILLLPRILEAALNWVLEGETHSSLVAVFNTFLPDSLFPRGQDEHLLDVGALGAWRSWTDSAAAILIIFGFTVSAYNRPASGRTEFTQGRFVRWSVLPVAAGALLLTASIASLVGQFDLSNAELFRFGYFGVVIYVTARYAAVIVARLFPPKATDQSAQPALPVDGDPLQPSGWLRTLLLHMLVTAGWVMGGLSTGLLIGLGSRFAYAHALQLALQGEQTADMQHMLAQYFTVYGPPWILACFLFGEVIFAGLTSRLPTGERDREWLARAAGWFGIMAVLYLLFSWLVIFGWDGLRHTSLRLHYLIAGSGLLSILGALLPFTRATAASATKEKLPITGITTVLSGLFVLGATASMAEASRTILGWLGTGLSDWLKPDPNVAEPVIQFAGSSLRLDEIVRASAEPQWMFAPLAELGLILVVATILIVASIAVSACINVNWFSLHALYRNRLVKTFLGASNVGASRDIEGRNQFDGFSEQDNLTMGRLHRKLAAEAGDGEVRLYPVLNMSLNILASHNLAWQERKAEPFISTPLHTGGHRVGYRNSIWYSAGVNFGKRLSEDEALDRGISLGTVMAISGAAVSPNWGYHSSPLTSFLMMLANVRLGWWLGNPLKKQWRYRSPLSNWRLFVQEALGWTDEDQPWVYLSDGGHFENLGLYEMVRRRCRTIVVSDAGADPNCTLEDLGNAVRKISIDLGVKIEFQRIHVRKRSDAAAAGVYCAVGDIRYPEGGNGKILFFKPGFYGTQEPADVRAYAAANAKFPHESTLNQWFGESQFESYRSLGAYVIEKICGDGTGDLTLAEFVALAGNYLKKFEDDYDTDGATVINIRRPVKIAAA